MNKWIGSGRLTENPSIRYGQDKKEFITFCVMCPREGNIPNGGQAVDFVDCKCFGRLADFARNYLRKGKKVEICGRIESGSYTDKNGHKVYTKTVLAQEISFGETKAEEEARNQAEKTPPPMPENAGFMEIPEGVDGELPFR
jgi:single-strand DNA-binding protein